MNCPHCVKYLPAIQALTRKIKFDKRSWFTLRDKAGNLYVFRVATKKDLSALKDIEDYFNISNDDTKYICKLGIKDKQLDLMYLDKQYFSDKIFYYFNHKLLV